MAKKEKKVKEEKSSSKSKTIIIVILALLVLGLGTFAGVTLFMKNNSQPKEVIINEIKVPVGEEIMINLNDEDQKRYLKAKVNISYDKKDKKAAKEVEAKAVEIKDKTIFYLKSKEVKDFEPENEANLKKGLVTELNKLMNEGKILNVYFDDLITQ